MRLDIRRVDEELSAFHLVCPSVCRKAMQCTASPAHFHRLICLRFQDELEANEAWLVTEDRVDILAGQLTTSLPPSAFYEAAPGAWEAKFMVAHRGSEAAPPFRRRSLQAAVADTPGARPLAAPARPAAAVAADEPKCRGLSLLEPVPDCLSKIISPYGERFHPIKKRCAWQLEPESVASLWFEHAGVRTLYHRLPQADPTYRHRHHVRLGRPHPGRP